MITNINCNKTERFAHFPKTTSGKNSIIFMNLIPNLKIFVFGGTDGKLSKVNLNTTNVFSFI
jgi:hypothetical protein